MSFNSTTGTGITVTNVSTQANSIVNLNGGTLNMNGLPIGTATDPVAFFNMTGGVLKNALTVYVGPAGTPGVIQTGGASLWTRRVN